MDAERNKRLMRQVIKRVHPDLFNDVLEQRNQNSENLKVSLLSQKHAAHVACHGPRPSHRRCGAGRCFSLLECGGPRRPHAHLACSPRPLEARRDKAPS